VRIGLISDIHANLQALEAVLEHLRENQVDTIWNMGDSVGYGAYPDEVLECIYHDAILSILGNYDRKVLRIKKKEKKWAEHKIPEKLLAFHWAYKQLSRTCRDYLSSLPEQIRMNIDGWKILIVHGSPVSREEHLTPSTPERRLEELSTIAEAQIVLCGHSHQPFSFQASETWFINPGSVGRPDDGDYRTSHAILDLDAKRINVIHYRLDYDVNAATREIRRRGLPEEFATMLEQGRSLDDLQNT
jgi:putative phosphoesterase